MRLAFLIIAAAFAQTARAEETTPDEALRKARLATSGNYRAAQVIGRFATRIKLPGNAEPILVTQGQFIGVYAKPHLRIDYELSIARHVSRDKGGWAVVDAPGGRRLIVADSSELKLVTFIDGEPAMASAILSEGSQAAGFPFHNPFRLGNEIAGTRSILRTSPLPAIAVARDGEKFIAKRALNGGGRVECIIDPAAAYHLTSYKTFDAVGTLHELKAKWKYQHGIWYVQQLEKSGVAMIGGRIGPAMDSINNASECTILSFRPNVEIDPKLFEPDALATPLDPMQLPMSVESAK